MTRYNNKHKVPNDKASEIRNLNNKELINRVSLEYKNWEATKNRKKGDEDIVQVKNQIKDCVEEMKANPDYKEAEDEFKAFKESLITEEHARFKEELKNLTEPYNEDIKAFEAMFKVAIEELDERKSSGILDL